MKTPSIKTLSACFQNPREAKRIMTMTHAELGATEVGQKRIRECWQHPKWYDVRLHVLNAIESGFHGVASMQTNNGEYADYLNVGDTYAPTVIYWRRSYRVQSIGDFVETMARQSVRFI